MSIKPNLTSARGFGAGLRPSRLAVRDDSWIRIFFSNLRDFLVERPVKLRQNSSPALFRQEGFGAGFSENLKEWLRASPAAARRPVSSAMLVPWKSGARTFWENLRDAVAPPKLPPLNVTSQPVPVPDIWSRNKQFKEVQALSFAVHVLVAVLLLVPLWWKITQPQTTQAKMVDVTPIDISPYALRLPPGPKKGGGGGGGGEHNPLPASKGRLPKFAWTQFAPPMVKPPEHPKLAMTATALGPPQIHLPSPNMPNYGDPLAKLINNSGGPGGGGGIGSGYGGGVGSGQGGGVGPGYGWGTGGGYPREGENGYGYPKCLYCPNPKFTDEAIKAKYQGVVYLEAVITPEGRATNIRVVKGIGMGLDESAIEAVRNWRFEPATGPDGRPASVISSIEVTYRLY